MTQRFLTVLSFLSLLIFTSARASAAEPEKSSLLYDGPAPFAHGTGDQDSPHLLEYIPDHGAAPSAAVIICPGGAYRGLSIDGEGRNEAKWFQARGIAAFVLLYRLPALGYRHPIPLQDVQRAMRWVRSKAVPWNIDPRKIGVMGFSAGGHLASTLETHFDAGNPEAPDPIDRVSCRPDFAILVYPVISMKPGLTHQGSKDNLLGPNPDPVLVESLSNETQVTAQTPPTIFFRAQDDPAVPREPLLLMYAALQKARVPTEMHEYPHGGHGFGFGQVPDHSPPGWMDVVLGWMRRGGFVS